MPIPAVAIPGLINAGTQVANAFAQGLSNRAQRKWNEKMYSRQRADALADWQMQNEYNSPLQQMQRLKDAGLNPNLVYGNGAQTPSAQVRQSDMKSWSPQAVQFNSNSVLNSIYDVQVKQAQIDNMKTQRTVMEREARLKEIEAVNKIISGKRSQFDLDLKTELRSTSIDLVKANLRKLNQDIDQSEGRYNWDITLNMDKHDMNAISMDLMRFKRDKENPVALAKLLESINNLRQQRAESNSRILKNSAEINKIQQDTGRIAQAIENAKKDGRLKELIIKIRELGLSDSDPALLKMLGTFLQNL